MHMNRASRRWLTHIAMIAITLSSMATASPTPLALAQSDGEVVLGPRGDAGLTGAMPGAGPTTQPTIQWEAPAEGVIMGMAIRGGLLYFVTKNPGTVIAVDRASGNVTWAAEFGSDSTVFGPEPAGDLITVGVWASDANAIVALDAATGVERWRVATDNLPTAPTHVAGTVYVAAEGGLSADSSLYALDAATGAQKWTFAAPEALNLGSRLSVSDASLSRARGRW